MATSIYSSLKIFDPAQRIEFKPDRAAYLVAQARGKRTLHVGCTDAPITADRLADGTLLHLTLRRVTQSILGIDISKEGLALLQAHGCDDVSLVDAEHLDLPERFECILAGDVLEHLNNPGMFIDGARRHLTDNGELIIGVPSALSAGIVKTWLHTREDVHRDHTFYFSPKTLAELCRRHGLLPTKLVFTTQPALPSESRLFVAVRSMLTRLQPALSPSLIMHFRPSETVDQSAYAVWK